MGELGDLLMLADPQCNILIVLDGARSESIIGHCREDDDRDVWVKCRMICRPRAETCLLVFG